MCIGPRKAIEQGADPPVEHVKEKEIYGNRTVIIRP